MTWLEQHPYREPDAVERQSTRGEIAMPDPTNAALVKAVERLTREKNAVTAEVHQIDTLSELCWRFARRAPLPG